MQDEQIFRVILIFGFVTVFPVGLYHRLKAHASKDKLDRRQEGIFILLTLRPIAAAKMLGLLAGVIHPGWMAWWSVGLPPWLRWIGVPLDTVERYDAYPADEGWVVLDERLPGQPRHVGAAATGPDGQIYVMGGRLPGHTNQVDRFDPKSEQFVSSNRHLPEVNNGQAAAVSIGPDHSASIYVVGGDGGRERVQVLPILNNLRSPSCATPAATPRSTCSTLSRSSIACCGSVTEPRA